MAVYDAFIFNDELDLLEVRLSEHQDFVDKFILVQSDRAFTGVPKQLGFDLDDVRFARFRERIVVVNASLKDNPQSAWENENLQREAVFKAVSFNPNDIVYFSDVDEIISKHSWSYLLERMKSENAIKVWLKMYYYYINVQVRDFVWGLPKLVKAKTFTTTGISGTGLRTLSGIPITPHPCGWHFSYVTSVENIIKKITSFSHQEYNNPNFNDPEKIKSAIRTHQDIFKRKIKLRATKVDSTYPESMLESELWKKFIYKQSVIQLAFEEIENWFLKGLMLLKRFLKPSIKMLKIERVKRDSNNEFSSRVFEQLIESKPETSNSEEWRRLIESLCFVLPQLEGWFSARQCAELFLKIVSSCKSPSVIVEVGSWKGRSSVFASRAAAVSNSKLYCVDTWMGNQGEGDNHPTVIEAASRDIFSEFHKNMTLFGCDNVVICRGDSIEIAKKWEQGSIDFLFIDASHDYESVLKDLRAWVPLVKPGGVICGDDWNREERPDLKGSVRKAFEDFFKSTAPNLGIVERFWAHQI